MPVAIALFIGATTSTAPFISEVKEVPLVSQLASEVVEKEAPKEAPRTIQSAIVVPTIGKEEILALAKEFAKVYNVSYNNMAKIMACEAQFKNVQSSIYKDGKREESFGVAQIHLPSHPNITKQQALDVKFSVEFIAQQLALGNGWMWYGYNPQLDVCTNGIDWNKVI